MTILGGNGEALLDGHVRVINIDGRDITTAFLRVAQMTLEVCQDNGVTQAIIADISRKHCGRNALYDGDNLDSQRRYQRGPGVTAVLLQRDGLQVIAERDFASV